MSHGRKNTHKLPRKNDTRGQRVITEGGKEWQEIIAMEIAQRHIIPTHTTIDADKTVLARLLLLNIILSLFLVPTNAAPTEKPRTKKQLHKKSYPLSLGVLFGLSDPLRIRIAKHAHIKKQHANKKKERESALERRKAFGLAIKEKLLIKPGQEKECAALPQILETAIGFFPPDQGRIMEKAFTDPASPLKVHCVVPPSAVARNMKEQFMLERSILTGYHWGYLHRKTGVCPVTNPALETVPLYPIDLPQILAYSTALVSDTVRLGNLLSFRGNKMGWVFGEESEHTKHLPNVIACGRSIIATQKRIQVGRGSVSTLFKASTRDHHPVALSEAELSEIIRLTIEQAEIILREFAFLTKGTISTIVTHVSMATKGSLRDLSVPPWEVRYSADKLEEYDFKALTTMDIIVSLLPEACQRTFFPSTHEVRQKTIDRCNVEPPEEKHHRLEL